MYFHKFVDLFIISKAYLLNNSHKTRQSTSNPKTVYQVFGSFKFYYFGPC